MEWLGGAALHPVVLIGVGSAVGGNLRYWLGRWIDSQKWVGGLPWGTFVINVTGSLILGFCAVWFLERLSPARRELYFLLGTGFCGGYTTFSTFEWRRTNWCGTATGRPRWQTPSGVLSSASSAWPWALAAHMIFGRR